MIGLLSLILSLTLLSACQVEGEVSSAKQVVEESFLKYRVHTNDEGWLRYGQSLNLTLHFPYTITVEGTPYIDIEIGSIIRRAYFDSGSGTKALVFRYFVMSNDYDSDGIEIDKKIHLADGKLECTNDQGLKVSAPDEISPPSLILKVDGGLPIITSITGPLVGRYQTGQHLDYVLNFSENVYVIGAVSFDINLFSGAVPVTYISGSGTSRLLFRRKILSTDFDDDGFTTGTILTLNAAANLAIKDLSGNYIPYEIPAINSFSVINSPGPVITAVTTPLPSVYVAGDFMDFAIDYSQNVEVTGTPTLVIKLATGTIVANYTGGSGSTRLTFQHIVSLGEYEMDGINLEPRIHLNGGSIMQENSVLKAATVFTPPDTSSVHINAFLGPSVFFITLPRAKTYTLGETIDFTLGFNRSIVVTGTPQLEIYVGLTPRTVFADFRPELSSDHNLVFRHTVSGADFDPDGITLRSPLVLNGATITDQNTGTNANLYYSVPDATGAKIIP